MGILLSIKKGRGVLRTDHTPLLSPLSRGENKVSCTFVECAQKVEFQISLFGPPRYNNKLYDAG